MGIGGTRLTIAAAAATSLLVFAAPAFGAERYAEPGGDGPLPCDDFFDACSLEQAVSSAQSGDIVYPKLGTYNLTTTIELPVGANLSAGGGMTFNSTAAVAFRVPAASASTTISGLTIVHNPASGSPTAGLELLAGTARYMNVTSSGDSACVVTGGITASLLTDSICHNTSASPRTAVNSFSAVDSTAKIYGVTAVSDNGYGLYVNATAPGADVVLTGGNVIAEGAIADQGGSNSSSTSTSSAINLSYSNLGTASFGTSSSGSDPNLNNNQFAQPLLDSNFRQLPGSPTLNAGGFFNEQSSFDIDGEFRGSGGGIDIGADEAEGDPPETLIDAKPPKRTSKRVAKFRFSADEVDSTFECKIDARPFKPCTSPATYRNLKRGKRHIFQVRATDVFSNTDESPATYRWKVLKN